MIPWLSRTDEAVDELGPDPRVPLGQGGGPQQHHGPDGFRFDVGADGGGVRADQADLQVGPLVGADVAVGEGSEAGRQAVDGPVARDQSEWPRPCGALQGRRPRRR